MMKQAFLTGKRSNFFLILVVLGLLFGMAMQAKAAESYDLTADFSSTLNPNGPWEYGYYTGLDKGTFTQFADNFDLPADLNTFGQCNPPVGGFLVGWRDVVDPNILKNTGNTHVCPGFNGITFNAGAVTFGPDSGPDGRFGAVVRFTVPSAGTWQVVATFTGVQVTNPSAAAWIHEGTANDTTFVQVDNAVENGETSNYSQTLTLPANATIDIVVGSGSRTTEVTATITKQKQIVKEITSGPCAENVEETCEHLPGPFVAGADLKAAELEGGGAGVPDLPVNGVWTYGSSAIEDAGAAFAAFPGGWHSDALVGGGCAVGFEGWQETPDNLGDRVPLVAVNTTGAVQPGVCVPGSFADATFWVHPNFDTAAEEYVVVRWTAPAAGLVDITADWVPKHTGAVSTHVRLNGVMLGSDSDTSGPAAVNFVENGVAVVPGDTIDFVTGNYTDNYFADSTQFDATITTRSRPTRPALPILSSTTRCRQNGL
jgi:hypothetical protein